VCVTRYEHPLAVELESNIPFTVLNRKRVFDYRGFRKLKEFADSQEVDIFHVHSRSTLAFLCVAKALGFIDQKILMHDHYGNIEYDQKVPAWFRFYGTKQLAYYIGVYQSLTDWAKSAGVIESKLSVVENAIDFGRFESADVIDIRHQLDIPQNRKICVMVGNIRFAKGLDLLIDACAHVSRDDLPAIIVIGKDAEPEYTTKCKVIISERRLDNVFYFVGEQENVIGWMKGADMGVIPSRSESGPLVLIEFMACGLPFVAANVGSISKRVSKMYPDHFVSPNNASQLAIGLTKCVREWDEHNTESEKLIRTAREFFDLADRVSYIEDIYDSIFTGSK
jgi:glycosyltransferase involved in cell wall biosynthesis